jgi:hypothetical protein
MLLIPALLNFCKYWVSAPHPARDIFWREDVIDGHQTFVINS